MIRKGSKCQSKEQKRLDITKILHILREPRTVDQICRLFFGKNSITDTEKKYIKNRLQIIKVGSHKIVYSENRRWRIDSNYISGLDELVSTVLKNHGLVWQRSATNRRRRAECLARKAARKKNKGQPT